MGEIMNGKGIGVGDGALLDQLDLQLHLLDQLPIWRLRSLQVREFNCARISKLYEACL